MELEDNSPKNIENSDIRESNEIDEAISSDILQENNDSDVSLETVNPNLLNDDVNRR